MKKRRSWRCPRCHKTAFRTYEIAAGAVRQLPDPEGRPYWCPAAKGWHLTRLDVGEYDRRQGEHAPSKEEAS